jgi:hypothetical protein
VGAPASASMTAAGAQRTDCESGRVYHDWRPGANEALKAEEELTRMQWLLERACLPVASPGPRGWV